MICGLSIALDDPGSGTLLTARLVPGAAGLLESDFEPVYLKLESSCPSLC